MTKGYSGDLSLVLSDFWVTVDSVCSKVTFRSLPEVDEVLGHDSVCALSSGRRYDGSKVTFHLSFVFSFSVGSTVAVRGSRCRVTVAGVILIGVAPPLFQEIQFSGQCVLGMGSPLRLGLPFHGMQE